MLTKTLVFIVLVSFNSLNVFACGGTGKRRGTFFDTKDNKQLAAYSLREKSITLDAEVFLNYFGSCKSINPSLHSMSGKVKITYYIDFYSQQHKKFRLKPSNEREGYDRIICLIMTKENIKYKFELNDEELIALRLCDGAPTVFFPVKE